MPGRERALGWAVVGIPFRSGHLLALRRFPATSVGPGYRSVWHRDPAGRWVIHQDQHPSVACPRAFGPGIDDADVVPIAITWDGPHRFTVGIDAPGLRLRWEVVLDDTPATRVLSALGSRLPDRVRRHPWALSLTGRIAGPALRAGRLRLRGTVPSGQRFAADLRRVWVVRASVAEIDGVDLGEPGPLARQERLRDFWLPQRGLVAVGASFFEPHDASRHRLVASRRELS